MSNLNSLCRTCIRVLGHRRGIPTRIHARAFTLVELLAVVGIITVLLALLLPVLGRAREHARATTCASNVRQIYYALLTYSNDNRGCLPVMANPGHHEPWLGITTRAYGLYDYEEGSLWRYVSTSVAPRRDVFMCPSDEPPLMTGWQGILAWPAPYRRNFSYNFNDDLGGPQPTTMRTQRFVGIRRSEHKVLVLEQEAPLLPFGNIAIANPADVPWVRVLSTRHAGRCNTGFADGHVERFDPAVLKTGEWELYLRYKMLEYNF